MLDSLDRPHRDIAGDYEHAVWDAYNQRVGRPQYIVIDRDFVVVHGGRDQQEAEELAASLL